MDRIAHEAVARRVVQHDAGQIAAQEERGTLGDGICADVLKRIQEGKLHKVLFVATGALMSTTSNQQGESIPAVAHLIYLSDQKEER